MKEDLKMPLEDDALNNVTGGAGKKLNVVYTGKQTGSLTEKVVITAGVRPKPIGD